MIKASITLGGLALVLLVLSFLPAAGATPAASATGRVTSEAEPADKGRALFMAKGCATCHRHADVGRQPGLVEVGPALTNYEPDETFVSAWLRDPQALRPGTFMPNLELSEAEIEALVAFLAEP